MRFFRLPRHSNPKVLISSVLIIASIISGSYTISSAFKETSPRTARTTQLAAAPVITPKLKPTATQLKVSKVPVKYVSSITTSETWSPAKAGVYIIRNRVTIPEGKTLTINPGTIIKLADIYSSLNPEPGATLKVAGSAANPVIFTSLKDDSVGGDTNKDKTLTKPVWDDSHGMIRADGVTNIRYAVFRYSSEPVYIACSTDVATISVADSVLYGRLSVAGCSTKGIIVQRNQFITAKGPALALNYTKLTNNITLSGVNRNIFEGSGSSLGVLINGAVVESGATWSVDSTGKQVLVMNQFTVMGTVDFSVGVIVKNANLGLGSIKVERGAIFNAVGSLKNPVVFTSFQDDAIGGDTNGDGVSSGASGQYSYALEVYGKAELSRVSLKNANQGASCIAAQSLMIVDSSIASQVDVRSCKKGSLVLKRNTFAVLSNNPVYLYQSDPSGLILTGIDKNNFTGTGKSRAIRAYNNVIETGSIWTVSSEGGGVLCVDMLVVDGVLKARPSSIFKGSGSYAQAAAIKVNQAGKLDFSSTSGSPIIFTSIKDDSVGGDSNGDGMATKPDADFDVAIWAAGSTSINLSNTRIRHAISGLFLQCSSTSLVNAVDNVFNSPVIVNSCRDLPVQLKRNTFNVTYNEALKVQNGSLVSGIAMNGADRNTFTGTGKQLVFRLENALLPQNTSWNVSGETGAVLVPGYLGVYGTLNLENGLVVKIPLLTSPYYESIELKNSARLNIKGVKDHSVVITSINDDAVMGDSAGDGYTTGKAGDSIGLTAFGDVKIQGDYVTMRYLRTGISVVGDAKVDMRNTDIKFVVQGMYVLYGTVTYRGSILNTTDRVITACNWSDEKCSVDAAYVDWGPTGPYYNDGQGKACGRVNVMPWKVNGAVANTTTSLFGIGDCTTNRTPTHDLVTSGNYFRQRVDKQKIDCSYAIQDACDVRDRSLKCYKAAIDLAASRYGIPINSEGVELPGYDDVVTKGVDEYFKHSQREYPTEFSLAAGEAMNTAVGYVASIAQAYNNCAP